MQRISKRLAAQRIKKDRNQLQVKFRNILLVFTLFLIFSSSIAQQTERSGSLFIIGGGSRPTEMVEKMIVESGIDKSGYVVILPMASIEPDSSYYYANLQFKNAGINKVAKLVYQSDSSPSKQQLDSLKNASLIYIPGGDQDRFMKAVSGSVAEAIRYNYRNGGMIAGTSAGAAVMSKKMITGNELKYPEYNSTYLHLEKDNIETKEGLGLISNVIIDQHFVRRSRYNRLITAVIEYPELTGIGIDESTAILVRGNKVEVVGDSQVIVFKNPNPAEQGSSKKLSGKGITLNIYLDGETFL